MKKCEKGLNANTGVSCDIQFTYSAKHDHFMLAPDKFEKGDILAMDRADMDYWKFEDMTKRGVLYVTKMKKDLTVSLREREETNGVA